MSYQFATERSRLFTEDGVKMLTKVRDNVKQHLATSGAVRADKAWTGVSGDSWQMLACLDYLVEIGEIRELGPTGWGQDRVFVSVEGGSRG
jgi:hypothetical protein